jgi:hypothetical protein
MARWEFDLDIQSTYCFQLTSPFYNLLSRDSNQTIKEIIECGHEIGLHYDPEILNSSSKADHLHQVHSQRKILEDVVQSEIKILSLHNPVFGLPKLEFNDIVSTYEPKYLQERTYISDSSMKFRVEDPIGAIIDSSKPVHLLLHPEYWSDKESGLDEIFLLHWNRAQLELKDQYDVYLEKIRESLIRRNELDKVFQERMNNPTN